MRAEILGETMNTAHATQMSIAVFTTLLLTHLKQIHNIVAIQRKLAAKAIHSLPTNTVLAIQRKDAASMTLI